MNNKNTDFIEWMEKNTRLSVSSIEKLSSVIDKISDDLIRIGVIKYSILEINEISELISLRKEYYSTKENKDFNNHEYSMYSYGFNRLIDFQLFKHSQI